MLTKENYYEEVYNRLNDKSGEIFNEFRVDLKRLGILPYEPITNDILNSEEDDDERIDLLKKKQLEEFLGFEVEFLAQEGNMVEEGYGATYNILLRIFNINNSIRSASFDVKWTADAGERYKVSPYSDMVEESGIDFIEESINDVIEKEFSKIEEEVYKEALANSPPTKRAKRTLAFRKSRKRLSKNLRKTRRRKN